MPTFEEGSVFEYCEKFFRELDNRDGGYFPSRHDHCVFSQTASEFSISEDEVNRIFNEYSKQAADIEIEKINRLPLAVRKKVLLKRASDIVKNNRDLPYFKLEGPPSKELPSALDILSDEYKLLIESIAHSGWTIPMSIDVRHFVELMKITGDDCSLDRYFGEYYAGRELRYICRKIMNAIDNVGQKAMFSDCVKSYEAGLYSVCITTLIAILEGFISTFGDNPQDVRIMRICNFHANEEMTKKNNIKSLCWLSIYEFSKILFEKSDFSQSEPSAINRHWIQHGRTGRSGEQIDCIRIFNALSTLVNVKQ